MKDFIRKNHRTLFYVTWFLLGLLQASFTELLDDEAYYWVYSRFLAWGYFDHPPMIGLLIRMGTAILPGEGGVRLLMVVLSTLTVYLCEKLISKTDLPTFYLICFSLAVLQIGGLLAVPDIPLMFFTALFFTVYKRFVKEPSLTYTALLSLVSACLLYSKYHGLLVIFFTLLSHLSLLRKWQTYAAGILTLLLFLPHLWWQYGHDWPSLKYHLVERNTNPYRISFTLDYLLGQILITGPVAGIILWYATFRCRTRSLTERALKATAIGIFVFFFLSSFRGRIEANWTAPVIVPVIVLSHQYLVRHPVPRRWVGYLLPATLMLVLLMRVVMIADVVPVKAIVQRFHSYKHWPEEMRQRTHGLPVVLSSSYQKASKYWFYSGQPTYSLNRYYHRRNNYNFWPLEDSLLGKPVAVFDPEVPGAPGDTLSTPIGPIRYGFDSSFHSFAKVIIMPLEGDYTAKENEAVVLHTKVSVPGNYRQYLLAHPHIDYPVKAGFFDKEKWLKEVELPVTLQQLVRQPDFRFQVSPGLPKGEYFLRFAIGSSPGWPTHNSNKIKLLIE